MSCPLKSSSWGLGVPRIRPWSPPRVFGLANACSTWACGTGYLARLIGETVGDGGRVVGIDLSESMIDYAGAMTGAPPIASSRSAPRKPYPSRPTTLTSRRPAWLCITCRKPFACSRCRNCGASCVRVGDCSSLRLAIRREGRSGAYLHGCTAARLRSHDTPGSEPRAPCGRGRLRRDPWRRSAAMAPLHHRREGMSAVRRGAA